MPYPDEQMLCERVREALAIADHLRLADVGIALNVALTKLGDSGYPPAAEWSMTDDLIIN